MSIERSPEPVIPVPRPKPVPEKPDPEKEALMTKRASKLIRAYEVAGGVQDEATIEDRFGKGMKANGGRAPSEVHFPSNSGATLGFGHDIGQASKEEIDAFYGPVGPVGPRLEILPKDQRETLKTFVGQPVVKGGKGTAAFTATEGIKLSYKDATEVFEKHLLPKYIDAARKAHPGFDDLPALQQAAIIDRTYMRGPGINPTEGKAGATAWTQLHEAIFERSTVRVLAALRKMEGLHKKSPLSSSTQGRARARSDLALEGYMSTQETGEVPWQPVG